MTDDGRDTIAVYSARRKRQVWLAVAFLPLLTGIYIVQSDPAEKVLGISADTLGWVFIFYLLVALLFTLLNWRCPACNAYLGRSISHVTCPKCWETLSVRQPLLSRLFAGTLKGNPTSGFPARDKSIQLSFDLDEATLNGIPFRAPVKSFRGFGPAESAMWDSRQDVTLLYRELGVASELDVDGVHTFHFVFDSVRGVPHSNILRACAGCRLTTGTDDMLLSKTTSEGDLAKVFGDPTDRFDCGDGQLGREYSRNGTIILATLSPNGSSLRHLELSEAA